MQEGSKESLIKGLLDWMQNLAVSMGIFAAAAALSFEKWKLNEHWNASGISLVMAAFSFIYVALATAHFIQTHAPSKDHPRRQGLWIVISIVFLATTAECTAIVVVHYTSWQHAQQMNGTNHVTIASRDVSSRTS